MRYTYKKNNNANKKKLIRYFGLSLSFLGILSLLYMLFPLISWKFFFEPVFASNMLQTPIPKANVLSRESIESLLSSTMRNINVDYSNATNWFPEHKINSDQPPIITSYTLSIPKLRIHYATVSTIDTNLDKHLIHYPSTAIPPQKGNAVIFGHSTIPQWFNPADYKTIFAKAHTLTDGDKIIITINGKEYTYTISTITVTTPDDTSIFVQDLDDSYLTLVTCTPPGTTWKRLIIKSRLDK